MARVGAAPPRWRGAARARLRPRAPSAAGSVRCSASRRSARRARRPAASPDDRTAFRWPSPTRRGTDTRGRDSGGCGRFAGPPARPALKAAGIARVTFLGPGDGQAARPRPRRNARRPRPRIAGPRAPDSPSGSSRFCGSYLPRRRNPRARRTESSTCSGSGRASYPAATLLQALCASRGGTARQGRCSSRYQPPWG